MLRGLRGDNMFDYIDLKKAVRLERAANERMQAALAEANERIAELTDAAIELAAIITEADEDG